jgi:type II secretory pathway pseudopilin PulG
VLPVRKLHNNNGFSLTEVLFAVATLAIAMLFIAGTFPVAIYFSTIATERTIAAVVADEAFAKIRLYADPNEYDAINDINMPYLGERLQTQTRFNDANAFPAAFGIDPNEFAYPSVRRINISEKKYFWSALCRRVDLTTELVQVTVFVSRKVGSGATYWVRNSDGSLNPMGSYPIPIAVEVEVSPIRPDELSIIDVIPGDAVDEKTFINDGYTIVDDETGQIYRVLERYAAPDDNRIQLDRPWVPGVVLPDKVWVVPPPANGGRYPCIAVYQKVIRF